MQRIQIGIIRKMNFHSLKCPLSRKPLLVRVTVQRKLHTFADSNSTYSGYALWNMCDSARHRVSFTLDNFERNLDTFSVLAITKSLSDSAVTVFLCCSHLFDCLQWK